LADSKSSGPEGVSVTVNEVTYRSALELEELVGSVEEVFFPLDLISDVVSMLEMSRDEVATADGRMEVQAKTKKAGFSSVSESRIVNSFTSGVPASLTKDA
jgi:hypothetical protein